jgi:hypothetical protein
MIIRDRSLSIKMGDLLSLISDNILFIGLFGGDNSGLWTGDDIGINDDMMNLEFIILDIFIIYD